MPDFQTFFQMDDGDIELLLKIISLRHSLKEEPEKEVLKILDVKLEQPDDNEDDYTETNTEYPEKFEMVNEEEEKKQASPTVEEKDEKPNIVKSGKVYLCDPCGKTFNNPSNFRQHKRRHGPKKHPCPHCERAFF